MVEQKLKDLINRDIDGGLSEEEGRKLRQSLRRSKSAQRLHKELTGMQVLLASVRSAEPPVHLANRIRAAVHASDPAAQPARSLRDSLPSLLRPRTSVRYGWVFMGGFVVGALLLLLVLTPATTPGIADSSAVGSMAVHAHSITVRAGDAAGTINVDRLSGSSEVTLSLTTPAGVVSRLEFDPSLVSMEELRGVESLQTGGRMDLRQGVVEFDGTGRQHYTVVFVPRVPGVSISLALASNNTEFFRTRIPIAE